MRTADVVVIGGGAIGASTAFHLTTAGVRDVLLVERRHLAAGATGKSGALVRMHYTNEPVARLALAPSPTSRGRASPIRPPPRTRSRPPPGVPAPPS